MNAGEAMEAGRERIDVDLIYDVDDGPFLGLYAKGHHDPAAFYRECDIEWDHLAAEAGVEYVRTSTFITSCRLAKPRSTDSTQKRG